MMIYTRDKLRNKTTTWYRYRPITTHYQSFDLYVIKLDIYSFYMPVMSFLPPNYEAPKASTNDYCKLKDWTTKIRILTSAVTGYQDWDDKTPVNTKDLRPALSKDRNPKHFWAMMVWNYDLETVQCLTLTQKSIQDAIVALNSDEDRGDPLGYDLKITRSGKDLETKYTVTPSNKAPISEKIKLELEAVDYDLENLFEWKQVIVERRNVDLPF